MLKYESNNVAILLKSNFHMGVLLSICCIFLEHRFLRTPLEGSSCSRSCYSYVLSLFTSLFVCISFFLFLNSLFLNFLYFESSCFQKKGVKQYQNKINNKRNKLK